MTLLALLVGCASGTLPARIATVPAAPTYRSLTLAADGKVSTSSLPPVRANGAIHADAGRIMNGEKALTEAFKAIDSFDVSRSRGEVVFSAKRADNFDIGLVSTDGSQVKWVPGDANDEIAVQWAPRGNKVSYVVRGKRGDVVRTVHIPTSAQLAVDFPYGTIHALAWDAAAERFAVAWSTPDASDRVEVMKYGGEDRRMSLPPSVSLDVEIEPLTQTATLLRPRDLAYDERVPLVVWRADDLDWNDARAALIRNARVAVAIVTSDPGDAFWRAIADAKWVNSTDVFSVGVRGAKGMSIIGDPAIAAGRYRTEGNVVTVAPAVVQSFAAGYIPDLLKRNPSTNGSSR